MAFVFSMNDHAKIQELRKLAKTTLLQLQPLAGEEMSLPQNDPHQDGFVDGERAMAARVLALLTEDDKIETENETVEEVMLLGV